METMIIGVGTNNKFTSKLIRRATRSTVSHAWLEFASSMGSGVIHAQPQGVVWMNALQVWPAYPKNRRFRLTRVSDSAIVLGIKYAMTLIGKPYDWSVVNNGFRLWWWYATGMVIVPDRNPYKLHCSEMVCKVLQYMQIDGTEYLDPEVIHPGKLLAFMMGHPQFVEL